MKPLRAIISIIIFCISIGYAAVPKPPVSVRIDPDGWIVQYFRNTLYEHGLPLNTTRILYLFRVVGTNSVGLLEQDLQAGDSVLVIVDAQNPMDVGTNRFSNVVGYMRFSIPTEKPTNMP